MNFAFLCTGSCGENLGFWLKIVAPIAALAFVIVLLARSLRRGQAIDYRTRLLVGVAIALLVAAVALLLVDFREP